MILPDSDGTRNTAAKIIERGGVIAFRTDTFYGLGANPFNASAVRKIKDLKGREANKPILVLISDAEQITRLIDRPSSAFNELSQRFWPGPLTIIGEATTSLPSELTAGTSTVGVRLPADDSARDLVRAGDGAMTATSANPAGEPPARTAAEVAKYFGDGIDLIVDGGSAKTDQPSTVIDATGAEVRLIREGVVPWLVIRAALDGK